MIFKPLHKTFGDQYAVPVFKILDGFIGVEIESYEQNGDKLRM